MPKRFLVRALLERVLPRLLPVGNGAPVIPPPLKVHGQFGGKLFRPWAVGRFYSFANPLVQVDSASRRDSLVEHFLVQRVQERIALSDNSIRPLAHAARADELSPPR